MSASAEIEARPSKIRKLDNSSDCDVSSMQITGSSVEKPTVKEGDSAENIRQNDQENTTSELEHEPKISKNQLKKLKRRERWEASREIRILKKREKQKEKKSRKVQERAELEAKITSGELEPPNIDISIQNGKDKRLSKHIQMDIGIILDTSFNDFMTEREIISLANQVTRCYSLNKSATYRTHLAISSWSGSLKSRFENILANTHLSWTGVSFLDDDFISVGKFLHKKMTASHEGRLAGTMITKDSTKYVEAKSSTIPNGPLTSSEKSPHGSIQISNSLENISAENFFEKDPKVVLQATDEISVPSATKPQVQSSSPGISIDDMEIPKIDSLSLVYLTSDSPHTLTCLSPNTSYIIGGIVDKNRHKGLCYKRACERGIPTAKLPIGDHMKMQSRTVLAVNHVVEIMLQWLETNDWGEAFLNVIPKRKGAVLKITDSGNESACLKGDQNNDTSANEE